jgi:carbon starvation protein
MNALFLVAAAAVAFVFGYRFYAKWLALEIFRLDLNYSTRAQSRPSERDYVPTHPQLLLGHHVAAITAVGVFAAPIVAIAWGWIPAFLWIVVGSSIAAGTYGVGSFWLASRYPEDLGQSVGRLIHRRARAVWRLLSAAVLLVLIAASAGLAASLLAAYPDAAVPTAATALTAWVFGSYLHGRAESRLLPAAAVALAAVLFSIEWLGGLPVRFDGHLTIALADRVRFTIDAVVVWVVLLLVYAFYSARAAVWKLSRPRGFLIALAAAVMLLLLYAALVVQHPPLDAPQFHSPPARAHALPWLFLMIGSGALAGWQLVTVGGVTGRELRRETDARYVGYAAALIQAAMALGALLLAATAFTDRTAGSLFAAAPTVSDFPRAATFFVDRYGRLVAALGLDAATGRRLAATVLAGLSLAVLEAGVRALKNLLIENAPPVAMSTRRDGVRTRLWLVVAGGALVALHDGHGLGGLAAWPLLAAASLWLAAAGLTLIAFALHRAHRAPAPVAVLAAAVGLIAAWSTAAQLWSWWLTGAWIDLGVGAVIAVLAALLLGDAVAAWRRAASAPPDSAP